MLHMGAETQALEHCLKQCQTYYKHANYVPELATNMYAEVV